MRITSLLAPLAAVAMVSAAQAAITVNLDHAELIRNNGTVYTPEGSPAVGGGFGGGVNSNGGYSFKLPAIPADQKIDSIVFHAGDSSTWWPAGTLAHIPSEVFGLRISDTKSFAGTDYGSGVSQPGTQITTGYFTGTVGTMPDVDITSWVNGTGGGYQADKYLLLRTGTTADEATINTYAARWWTNASNAQLIITTSAVPEPAALAVLGLSALALVRRHRQA